MGLMDQIRAQAAAREAAEKQQAAPVVAVSPPQPSQQVVVATAKPRIVLGPIKPAESPKPHTEVAVSSNKVVLSPQAHTPQKISAASVLSVEVNTFERGSEKYTQEEMEQLKGALEMLRDNITDRNTVGQVIRTVMLSLKENPELKEIVKPEDIGLMVQGLRNAAGAQIAKKVERKGKAEGKKSFQKQVDDMLGDIEF